MGVLGRSFRFSPQRLNAFLEIQETLQSSQKHIQESAFTRWLTNSEAFLSFFSSLPSALLFLRQQSATDNTCVGLFKTFSKIDNLGLVFILCDVFPQLARLSKMFQRTDVDYGILAEEIPLVLDFLDHYSTNPVLESIICYFLPRFTRLLLRLKSL